MSCIKYITLTPYYITLTQETVQTERSLWIIVSCAPTVYFDPVITLSACIGICMLCNVAKRDSSVDTVTKLLPGLSRSQDSISHRGKRSFFPPKRPNRFWGKVKVKVTLEQATKAQRGGGG
jgi:hypothetical protein